MHYTLFANQCDSVMIDMTSDHCQQCAYQVDTYPTATRSMRNPLILRPRAAQRR